MRKKHGPDFKRELIQVESCKTCRGTGVRKGISFQLPCEACAGVGWIARGGSEAPIEDIARALGARMAKAERQLAERAQIAAITRRARDAEWNNEKGPGGSHYRGD